MKKYLLFIYLLVNLTAEYYLFASISKVVFYITLALAIPICMSGWNVIRTEFRSCPYFLWWIVIYIIYQFLFGWNTLNLENVIYLVSKITTFLVILYCVGADHDFYFSKMNRLFGYIILVLMIVGFNMEFQGGRSYGFYNPNAGTSVAMLGASCFLFSEGKMKFQDKLALLFFIVCIFIGHSRNALVTLLILALFRFKMSPRLMIGGFLIVAVLVVFQSYGVELTAFDRMIDTFKGTELSNRDDERDAAIWMIQQHPWDGNGFNSKNYGEALALTEYGAHNGYLTILKMMGIIMGGAWLFVLFLALWHIKGLAFSDNLKVRRQMAIVIAIAVGAINEDFFVGVNQISTNMFFVSLCLILQYKDAYDRKKKEIRLS